VLRAASQGATGFQFFIQTLRFGSFRTKKSDNSAGEKRVKFSKAHADFNYLRQDIQRFSGKPICAQPPGEAGLRCCSRAHSPAKARLLQLRTKSRAARAIPFMIVGHCTIRDPALPIKVTGGKREFME